MKVLKFLFKLINFIFDNMHQITYGGLIFYWAVYNERFDEYTNMTMFALVIIVSYIYDLKETIKKQSNK